MRGLRSFLVLVVVAAALGGFLYYDSKRPPADEKKQEKVFADVQSDKIDRVSVKSDKGETTIAVKQGDRWQQTQPAAVAADEAKSPASRRTWRRSRCSASSTSSRRTSSSSA
jgi:hypothetical protein